MDINGFTDDAITYPTAVVIGDSGHPSGNTTDNMDLNIAMNDIQRYRQAADNIVSRSLGLRVDQNLLILADETSLPVAGILVGAALELGVSATTIYVPRIQQQHFRTGDHLPTPLELAIGEAHGVFSCLSPDAECTAFRVAVVAKSCGNERRTAHAPGFNIDILPYMAADFDLIELRCELIAHALMLGRQITLDTYGGDGSVHTLVVDLDGFEMPPGISNGRIQNSEWANLPPGETFIVPVDGEGKFVVNGAIPGHAFNRTEELVLRFEHGKCVDIQASAPDILHYFHDTQIAPAESVGDVNWRNLAEVGFGMNAMIDQLLGIELIDEKKAGTVHVALGGSDLLGGRIQSSIHCDLVTVAPTVFIDDKPILDHGKWVLNVDDWLLDYRMIDSPQDWWAGVKAIRRSGSRAIEADKGLCRVWGTGLGRTTVVPVGNDATAMLALQLYRLLPDRASWFSKSDFLQAALGVGISTKDAPGVLRIMARYDLVRFQED